MSIQQLLEEFTTYALKELRQGDDRFDWGEIQERPHILHETYIVLPPYKDEFLGLRAVVLTYNEQHELYCVINAMGFARQFVDKAEALKFAMEC